MWTKLGLTIVLIICFEHSFAASIINGGHLSWKPGSKKMEIELDYALFFNKTSKEYNDCTATAIEQKTIFTSQHEFRLWASEPTGQQNGVPHKSNLQFYCIFKDTTENIVIMEFAGLKINVPDGAYIGFSGSKTAAKQPIYTYVNYEKRPKGTINHSPQVTVFPIYVAHPDKRTFRIHAVDDDRDIIKCTDAKTKQVLNNCDVEVPSNFQGNYYTVIVEDFLNEKSQKSFSKVIVQFEIKQVSWPSDLFKEAHFNIRDGLCYRFAKRDLKGHQLVFLLELPRATLEILPEQVMAQHGTSGEIGLSFSRRRRFSLNFHPSIEFSDGKHLICVRLPLRDSNNGRVYYSNMPCITLTVGSNIMKANYTFPQPGSAIDNSTLDRLEMRVHGAFKTLPSKPNNITIYEKGTGKVFKPNNLRATITNDNRLIYKFDAQTLPKGDYYIDSTDGFFHTYTVCDHVDKNIGNKAWDFSVKGTSPHVITGGNFVSAIKGYDKTDLKCHHDKLEFFFTPSKEHQVSKITLLHDFCKMRFNSKTNRYEINAAYTLCGTVLEEEKDDIVYKNVAQVFFVNQTSSNALITRAISMNIGLECRLKKSSIQTLKGVEKDDSDMDDSERDAMDKDTGPIIVGPQSVQINDYARSNGSFRIDFQVYKSMRYNSSYGTEEFPIFVSLRNRMYFEISLDKKDLRVVPQNCYATKTRSYLAQPRYYIIEDRCSKDDTFQQHKYGENVYRFSVQAFNFKNGGDSLYIHCHTYVCKNTTEQSCNMGCGKTRGRRSIDAKEISSNVHGYMTSTLEIKITGDQATGTVRQLPEDEKDEQSPMKILIYMQIPIAIMIIGVVFLLWKCMKQRRNGPARKLAEDEANLTMEL